MLLIFLSIGFVVAAVLTAFDTGIDGTLIFMVAAVLYGIHCWRYHVSRYMIMRDVVLLILAIMSGFVIGALAGGSIPITLLSIYICYGIGAVIYPSTPRYPRMPVHH